jgi:hypothetical protein
MNAKHLNGLYDRIDVAIAAERWNTAHKLLVHAGRDLAEAGFSGSDNISQSEYMAVAKRDADAYRIVRNARSKLRLNRI